jgi:hypothetical protein
MMKTQQQQTDGRKDNDCYRGRRGHWQGNSLQPRATTVARREPRSTSKTAKGIRIARDGKVHAFVAEQHRP